MAKNKMAKDKITKALIFAIYMIAICYYLFFAESMGRTVADSDFHYNLNPFFEIDRIWRNRDILGIRYVVINLIGNVVAFIPFGYLLPQLPKKKLGVFFTVLFSLEFSLVVEIIQLITRKGSFDVDDLILNTLGGFVGFIIYKLIILSSAKAEKK